MIKPWNLACTVLPSFVITLSATNADLAAETTSAQFATTFTEEILPFLEDNCYECHDSQLSSADLNLQAFASADEVASAFDRWELIRRRLESGEMPPEEAGSHPTTEEREAIVDWIRAFRRFEAEKNAGDPGQVLARRLSNAEYNYTIRDLIGHDIQPTKEFPVDPANEAGFDNSGESLAMSPALLTKYLSAARLVSERVVLKPEGFDFASHPVVTNTDRDKYAVNRIVDFYKRQPTDLADYFQAAWEYRHRETLGSGPVTLGDVASAQSVSAKYLRTVWSALAESEESLGPLAKLQSMWHDLPAPAAAEEEEELQTACEAMRDFVVDLREKTAVRFDNLRVRGMHEGSQPLVMWRNRQHAINRRNFDPKTLRVEGEEPSDQFANRDDDGGERRRGFGRRRGRRGRRDQARREIENDPNLVIPADADRAEYEAAFARFASIFPHKFYVSERGREFLGNPGPGEKGRLLSAGFHSMMGYFRDDQPLCELVLTADEQQELDALWQELDFITFAPMRQHKGFVWFERTDSRFMISEEFDFARAEDEDVTSEEKLTRLLDVYHAKAAEQGADEVELQAIEDHFENINAAVRWVEAARLAAEPSHLEALAAFARRAYRRPLKDAEREELLGFYQSLRDENGLGHEDAIRDTVASVLMSPHFLFRLDVASNEEGIQTLDDYALASRLSYFLWSSMPDQELLDLAAAGKLGDPEVLASQSQRMLQDEKVRGLAVEFGGNWLDIRRFEEHNAVDRERFPSFDDELRAAMFEESVRFTMDLIQQDRTVLEFLYADHTFVNAPLARHYGMPDVGADSDSWVRVDNADQYERGGLLPMSVFLTKNAPGLRTSPVKRGYWVVKQLLGEEIPPPPPEVPELPDDEAKLGDLTLRETLARHRQDPSCAACHERFDSIGLAFEGYGPIGELRTEDLGGRSVETTASFPGGDEGAGVAGLKDYLREHRQEDFLDNLCRKLLSYALGRSLILSDDSLLREMRDDLTANDYRFGVVVDRIVTSPQFLNTRGRVTLAKE